MSVRDCRDGEVYAPKEPAVLNVGVVLGEPRVDGVRVEGKLCIAQDHG